MKDMKKIKLINIILIAAILLGMCIFFIIKPDSQISQSERRMLKTMPEFSVETVFGKKGGTSFMDEFELYAKDQFPGREHLRTVNALAGRYLLGRKEINDLYVSEGALSKLENGIAEKDLDWAAGRFEYILDNYVSKDGDNSSRAFMTIIPDKNYYIAPENGYPYVDVEKLASYFEERLGDRVSSINLVDKLDRENYYLTDTHWKQESLTEVSKYLLNSMGSGSDASTSYHQNELAQDFYGVYHGQAALPLPAEKISYLTWDGMEDIKATCYDSGSAEKMEIYDFDKAGGMDPYEFFLSGSKALITLENPEAEGGELVLFRDSFGSSLAPLLTSGYKKITLVDIRYISPVMLGRFVDFEDADILFAYSSTVLAHWGRG